MPRNQRLFAQRSPLLLPGLAGALLAAAILAGPGCGGRVVVDPIEGEGGSGGAPATTTTVTTTTTTTTTSVGGAGGGLPQTLTEVPLGYVDGGLNVLYHGVPPGTLGFTVLVQPTGAPDSFAQLGVRSLNDPGGAPLIADYQLPPTAWTYAWYGITAAAVPQSDHPSAMPAVVPGEWAVSVDDPTGAPTTGEVTMWLRATADGQFHGGELDVNVFIAGNATTPQYMQEMLLEAFSGYAGLGVGTVSFYELGSQWSVIQSALQLLTALEQTAMATRRPALNILAIADLTGELDQAAGVAAGIPGQGVIHGTHGSGVVMEVYEDLQIDPLIIEHEGGHLAGLFHTSEILPPGQDPLSDTPYCPDVENSWDTCPDFDNVMFPYGSLVKQRTPMQERVIRGSTLYRGIYADGYPPDEPLEADAGAKASGAGAAGVRPSLVVDLSRRAPAAPAARPAPSRAWAAGLSRGAAAVLSGVWCREGGIDHVEVLRRAGAGDARKLLAIGADPAAPVHVRKRALIAAGRMQPPGEVVAALRAIAESGEAPRQARIGALRGLTAARPSEAASAAQRLGQGDEVLAEVARRVLGARR